MVYSGLRRESGDVELPADDAEGNLLERMLAFDGSPCLTSTMLLRRAVAERIHPFEHRHGADDIGMKIELARRTEFAAIDEPLLVAGEPPDSLGTSWDSIEGRWELLARYEPLYERAPEGVRLRALAETYRKTGRRYLDSKAWSGRAIVAFAKSLYYQPNPSLLTVGEFLTAFGGRLGRMVGRSLRQ